MKHLGTSLIPVALLAPALTFSVGCAPQGSQKPQVQFEVVTVEEQALEAIAQTPTEFTVSQQQDEEIWERSHLFFKTYTSGATASEFDYPSPGVMLHTRSSSKDRYLYEIERRAAPGGYRYAVSCSRNPSMGRAAYDLSARNGKNVARFLREGHLELSLLDR